MSGPSKPSEVPVRSVVPLPRVTLLGLAWLVAVFALCNGAALSHVRRIALPGRTAGDIARLTAYLLVAANALAAMAGLHVYLAPRLLPGSRDAGWARRAMAKILGWSLLALGLTMIDAPSDPEGFREAFRGPALAVGVAAAALCGAWGVGTAFGSIRPRHGDGA